MRRVTVDPRADGGPNVPRNAQTIFNVALYNRVMFHDGRVFVLEDNKVPGGMGQSMRTTDSELAIEDMTLPADFGLLEAQALFPVTSTNEMRGRHRLSNLLTNADVRDRLVARIRGEADADHMARNDWAPLFREAFNIPDTAAPDTYLTFHNIARAIAAYERSQYFVDMPWRDFMAGDDAAISDAAKRGALLFYGDPAEGGGGCSACHGGAHFTDEKFHVAGFPQIGRGKRADRRDMGRYAVVQHPANLYAFRTPSLHNVALTAPYGHAGTFDTLEDVVAYHADTLNAVDVFNFTFTQLLQFASDPVAYPLATGLSTETVFSDAELTVPRISPLLQGISLSAAQRADLVAFLHTLTDTCAADVDCLDRWVPGPELDPDGNQLVRTMDPEAGRPADPGDVFMGPPGTGIDTGGGTGGGGTGGGGTGGGGTGGGGTGSGGGTGVIPAPVERFVAGQTHCPDRVGQTASSTGFTERSAALGLTHTHHFLLPTWLAQTLEDALQSAGVAAGDLDGDCDMDLVFTGGAFQGALVYRNDGADGYTLAQNLDTLVGSLFTGPAIADLDGDYQPDILLGNMRPGLLMHVTGNTEDGYALQQSVYMANNTFGMAVGDADGDGRLDVYAGHWDNRRATDASPALLRNDIDDGLVSMDNTAGTSASIIARQFQFAPAFVDIDGDGAQDLLIAADFLNSQVLRNDGAGHFTSITNRSVIKDQNGMGAAIADFDGDGHLDWFVSAIKGPTDGRSWPYGVIGNRLYRGHGDGTFTDVTETAGVGDAGWAWGSCAGDFNNDGHPDLFVVGGYARFTDEVLAALDPEIVATVEEMFAGYYTMVPRLWINDGSGHFTDEAAAWGITEALDGRGVSCADADRDGDVDLFVSQNEDFPRYYENGLGAGTGRHFLSIALRGPAPNTAGIGAMVEVVSASGRQVMPVAANSNYISQNPVELHVGLGSDTEATVTVRWPDGSVTTTADVPANRFLVIPHAQRNVPRADAGLPALQDAIARSQAWLVANPPAQPRAMLALRALSPRFDVPLASAMQAGYDASVDTLYAGMDLAAAQVAEMYRRHYDAAQASNAAFFSLSGADALLLPALYCREMALPAGYAGSLSAAATTGGQTARDALRALLLLRDNNCDAGVQPTDTAALHAAVLASFSIADSTLDTGDIEAAALLAAAGRADAIPAAWLDALLAAELDAGGWASSTPVGAPPAGTADESATVLATWLLQELAWGDRRFGRMVAR